MAINGNENGFTQIVHIFLLQLNIEIWDHQVQTSNMRRRIKWHLRESLWTWYLHLMCLLPTCLLDYQFDQLYCTHSQTPWLQKGMVSCWLDSRGSWLAAAAGVSVSQPSAGASQDEEEKAEEGGAAARGGSDRPSSNWAAQVPDRLTGCLIGPIEITLLQIFWIQHKIKRQRKNTILWI